jgi:hypothetical protein
MTRRLLFACLLIAGCGHKTAPAVLARREMP